MTNSPTILTLHFADGVNEVEAVKLSLLLDSLSGLYSAAWGEYAKAEAAFFYIAEPYRGSLSFKFRIDFTVHPEGLKPTGSIPNKHARAWARVAEVSAIGSFLWAVTFAGGGLFEHPHPETDTDEAALSQHLRQAALNRNVVEQGIQSVKRSAQATGAIRVVVEVVPEEPTVIYGQEQPSSNEPILNDHMPFGPITASVSAEPGRVLNVVVAGQSYRASASLVGPANGSAPKVRALIVWPEKGPIPSGNTPVSVQGTVIPFVSVLLSKAGLGGRYDGVVMAESVLRPPPVKAYDWNE